MYVFMHVYKVLVIVEGLRIKLKKKNKKINVS